MIKELKINPIKTPGPIKAQVSVVLESGIEIGDIDIRENKKGLRVVWNSCISFESKEARKAFDNRILATWVINHCVDEYTEREPAC
jgi:DNA-binding cell septation regulator SpoVG